MEGIMISKSTLRRLNKRQRKKFLVGEFTRRYFKVKIVFYPSEEGVFNSVFDEIVSFLEAKKYCMFSYTDYNKGILKGHISHKTKPWETNQTIIWCVESLFYTPEYSDMKFSYSEKRVL